MQIRLVLCFLLMFIYSCRTDRSEENIKPQKKVTSQPFIGPLGKKMNRGYVYMTNLDHEAIDLIINDSKEIMTDSRLDSVRAFSTFRDIPQKYRDVGIRRLDINKKSMSFVWVGGFNCTALSVSFRGDSCTVTARYSINYSQQLYPICGKVEERNNLSIPEYIKGNTVLQRVIK